jgi:hypothetical protein
MSKNKGVPKLAYSEPTVYKSARKLLGLEVGGPDLLMSRFPEKTIHQLLAKHMGRDSAREKKNPREVLEQAKYYNTAGAIAMPSTAFKNAILTASSVMTTYARNKVPIRIGLHVRGASVPISFESETPCMDVVRCSGVARDPDVRFRPQFDNWRAKFVIQFDDEVFSESLVLDLVDRAGRVGVGEWRPECNGTKGTFQILSLVPKEEIDDVIAQCAPPIKPIRIPEWALDADLTLDDIQKIVRNKE